VTLLDAALAWHRAGCSVIPVRTDGTKMPAVTWKAYQEQPASEAVVTEWFTSGRYDGIGVICGAVSGHLELFEVEGRAVIETLPAFRDAMRDNGHGDLWDRLNGGFLEQSPSGGMHWLFRVDGGARRNLKLARRPATADELAQDPADKVKVLLETRGEGGYVVVAPSAGRTHPTGKAWTMLVGSPAAIPTITVDERDALHAIASMFDLMPASEPIQPRLNMPGDIPGGTRPGDDFNQRGSWDDILTPQGWTKTKHFGGNCYGWVRPGKNTRDGISATTGRNDGDNLFVFSSSTEFDTERPYSKFSAYALLEWNGDYSSAAKQLRADGYGDQPPPITPPRQTLAAVDGTAVRVVEPIAPARVAAGYGPTEDGTARALAELHAEEIRYCPQRGSWLRWTGARWTWDDAETVREHVRAIARDLPEDDGWKTYKKRALSAAGVSGVTRLAQSDSRLTVHIDQLDAHPYELNTPGGIIDLRTGTLRPPDPGALHTRSTTATPDFDRPSETLDKFLNDTFAGDYTLTTYVQRLLGLSAVGTVLEQILPFAHGSGANGKSTLLEAVMHALGRGDTGYAISAPSEMLMIRKHSEHPAEIAQLSGARLVVCSELDDGQRFAEARIKQLTGRDSINARFMRRDPFTFTPTHTIWLLGNHQPNATTGGPAFWRRVQLVPFEHVVPEEQRDPTLGEKLAEESAAVLAWLARGAADYANNGLRTPDVVRDATQDYADDQDTIGRFVNDLCHLAPGHQIVRVLVRDLRAEYERWCIDVGETPATAKRLTQELRDRFNVGETKSNGKRYYTEISLLASDESDPADDERERYR
jgi:putative DNA primase/helicase